MPRELNIRLHPMMRPQLVAVVAALFVAAVCADHHEHDYKADFDKLDHRIDAITARIHNLATKIDARVDPVRIRKAHSLEERVVHLEGNGCAKREFQCGTDDPQCIGRLLVCDGVKDCRNGHDEDHCDLPTKAGDYFEGHMVTDTCTKRRPDAMDIEIKTVRHDPYFQTAAFVRAVIHIEYDDGARHGKVSLPTVGFYSFGAKKLALMPPEEDRLGLTCEFDGWNIDRCHGEIKHEGSLDVCATLVFTRQQHHDDDHHDDHDHDHDHDHVEHHHH